MGASIISNICPGVQCISNAPWADLMVLQHLELWLYHRESWWMGPWFAQVGLRWRTLWKRLNLCKSPPMGSSTHLSATVRIDEPYPAPSLCINDHHPSQYYNQKPPNISVLPLTCILLVKELSPSHTLGDFCCLFMEWDQKKETLYRIILSWLLVLTDFALMGASLCDKSGDCAQMV